MRRWTFLALLGTLLTRPPVLLADPSGTPAPAPTQVRFRLQYRPVDNTPLDELPPHDVTTGDDQTVTVPVNGTAMVHVVEDVKDVKWWTNALLSKKLVPLGTDIRHATTGLRLAAQLETRGQWANQGVYLTMTPFVAYRTATDKADRTVLIFDSASRMAVLSGQSMLMSTSTKDSELYRRLFEATGNILKIRADVVPVALPPQP